MITPTPEQQEILDLGVTSVRVRAGAGTGKTTTVGLVIANLVENHGISPESILGLTFTNKAAAELSSKVRELLPAAVDAARQVEVHTYHGFAAQLLAEFGPIAGVDTSRGVITPTFGRQLIRDVVMSSGLELNDITNIRVTDKVRRLADQMGDHLLTPPEVIRAGAIHSGDETWQKRLEIVEVLDHYNKAKAELRVVDYADLVTTSRRVLEDNPELAEIVRSRYRVVVLDEYQDTNPAQRVLLTTVFGNGFPVVAVGDEDQTIYEWRGASAENFADFGSHFALPDGSPAHDKGLTLNRRSGQDILDIANDVRRMANPSSDPLTAATNMTSSVTAHWAADALAEAEWIARRFEELHESGVKWSDMAVLFRKNKDFSVVVDVLAQHDIPMEVANVGGLLSVPEIGVLRSWLGVLDDPADSASVAQILLGSSYRLGIADLATLTRAVASRPREEDSENAVPISLIEVLESREAIARLSNDARTRVERFHSTYRNLLLETQGRSLAETCRLILDQTRAWRDVEAMPPNARLSARLNLYRFLDLADDWSPLSGRPSLSAFLEYLLTMEDEPADELDSARLSGEEAVTLITVHRAKGLEWENVAIPSVTHNNFPSGSSQYPDPIRFPEYLPADLRLDKMMEEFPDDETGQKAFLRERHMLQEWRVAYVALTRAKRRLFISGAYWYGLPEPKKTPSKPSELFEMIEGHPASTSDGHAETGPRPDLLRPNTDIASPDPLWPDGWQSGLRMATEEPERLAQMARDADVEAEYTASVDAWNDTLFDVASVEEVDDGEQDRTVSVTGLVTYAQCPKRFFWTEVDPLPRKANPAAVRGNEVHRKIELDQRGQVPFEDMEPGLYDSIEDVYDGVSAYETYKQSRFASRKASLIEAPFTVGLESGFSVRGRIDAVYSDDAHWEIVDFKSGRRSADDSRLVQLQAYAVAANDIDFGIGSPETMDVTFAYLGDGLDVETTQADPAWVSEARGRLNELTVAIEAEQFHETPGKWCTNCDFLRFCGPGQEEVRS